jgi:hypothetical protein
MVIPAAVCGIRRNKRNLSMGKERLSKVIITLAVAVVVAVDVLIEVPVLLMLVKICLRTPHWFAVRT